MIVRLVALVAVLVLAGCAAPAASPTAAPAKPTEAPKPAAPAASPSPAASPAASPSPSPVAAAPTVNGEVASVDGRVLTVSTNTGVRSVQVPESAKVQIEAKGAPSDLKPGLLVAVTGKPDGTAVVVRIFPDGIPLAPSQFPMGGPQAGNIMTNAKIESFDGRVLTLDMGGQKVPITFAAESEVVQPMPSTFTEIQPGKRVLAFGSPGADTLVANTVTILTTPPVIRAQ